MAQYKIQRAKGVEGSTVYTYVAPGHNECVPTRLHDPADVDGGKMIQGITYFIPGGGCDYGANPLESIYYILEGQMTLKTEDGETVLNAGDSFHCSRRLPQERHQQRHHRDQDAGHPAAASGLIFDSSSDLRIG